MGDVPANAVIVTLQHPVSLHLGDGNGRTAGLARGPGLGSGVGLVDHGLRDSHGFWISGFKVASNQFSTNGSGLQPSGFLMHSTWGYAPCWYGARLWRFDVGIA